MHVVQFLQVGFGVPIEYFCCFRIHACALGRTSSFLQSFLKWWVQFPSWPFHYMLKKVQALRSITLSWESCLLTTMPTQG